jgi:branched-chain amino acid aminotransferase
MVYFNYNGKIHPEGTPVIGVDNRGLRYGDGLFETIKMINGKLLFEDDHFARLWKGLKALEFDIPKNLTVDFLQKEMTALAQKNGHANAARIRLNIVRGDGGLYDAKNHLPNYIIQSWPLAPSNGEWNSNGLVLGIYEVAKKSCDLLSNLKHNNYLPYVLAALKAKSQKWNDAIVLNTNGRICDTTIANIFIVKDGAVFTPSLQEGCVAGVMRRVVIQQVLKSGIDLIEKEISISELLAADEVFLTNSIYNIRWVQGIGDITFKNSLTYTIFSSLQSTIL